jgi:hypothetical protein
MAWYHDRPVAACCHRIASGGIVAPSMLKRSDVAPDFRVGDRSLHEMLRQRAVVFFFPKAFTAG